MIYLSLLVLFIVILFLINRSKDNSELVNQNLEEKFNVIIKHITNFSFDGNYQIKQISKRHIMIFHNEISNQMIEMLYNQGVLTIHWKYKYFQKERIFKKHLNNVRNLSLFEQNKIGKSLVETINVEILNFQGEVLK